MISSVESEEAGDSLRREETALMALLGKQKSPRQESTNGEVQGGMELSGW